MILKKAQEELDQEKVKRENLRMKTLAAKNEREKQVRDA